MIVSNEEIKITHIPLTAQYRMNGGRQLYGLRQTVFTYTKFWPYTYDNRSFCEEETIESALYVIIIYEEAL